MATERPDLPWFTYYLGNLNWESSEYAEELYRIAAERFHSLGSEEGEVFALINRSVLLTRMGRLPEARAQAERVVEITEASGAPELRAWGRITLARQLLDGGEDLARAYDLLRNMSIPDSLAEASSLRRDRLVSLGNVCMMIGRFAEARDVFQSQVDLAVSRGDAYSEANARLNLAWAAYERLREAPTGMAKARAVSLARRALEVGSQAGHRSVEALASWFLGVLIPGEVGAEHLENCHEKAEGDDLRSLCLNSLASRRAEADPGEGQRMIRASHELALRSGDAWAEARVWQEALRIAWVAEPPEKALDASWEALDAIERLRDRQSRGSSAQAGMFSVWTDDYAWLVGRLLDERGRSFAKVRAVSEAFQVSERMRARALTDWLRRADAAPLGTTAGDSIGIEEAQAALRPAEALLSFQIAPWEDFVGSFAGGSWLLAVTRDDVAVHRLPGRVDVRRAVDLFDGLIERRDGVETRVAVALYEKLLAPALAELPPEVERMVLVPDDALHRLPFAALRESADAEPLGVRYELVQVPSATLWLEWRQARASAPDRPILVLADPDSPVPGGEPEGAEVTVAQLRDAVRDLGRDLGQDLGRLPHARREGRAAVRALGDGLLLVGAEASEARLGALPLGDFGLVHFAAHALTDEDRPERSAVLLAPGGGADGLLESAEIAGLDLAGRTVVLASCRSASGTVLRGEGVMSLARAFFQAGSHGVVASLWPLRDDESEALFGRFYRHLAEGASIAGALHRARREAVEAGEPAAAWAGLVVLGDGAEVPMPEGRRSTLLGASAWPVLWLLLGLAVVAGAAAAWRLRSRRA